MKSQMVGGQTTSRRRLLQMTGLGLASGLVGSLLAACGSGSSSSATTTSQSVKSASSTTAGTAPAATGAAAASAGAVGGANPVSGGTLTMGILSEPPIMDPRVSGSAEATDIMLNLFDTLVVLERSTNQFKPGLATSWESATDGKSYTFKLRSGVKFHDGTPFNADAVKYTYDSIEDPALKSLSAINGLGPYAGTDVVDPQTVRVNFTSAYPPFLNSLQNTTLAPVSPTAAKKAGPSKFGLHPVGTGPFMFKQWLQKISMTFVKNPDYAWATGLYHHQGPAYLDQIVIKFIPEPTTLDGSLTGGQLDITDTVAPRVFKDLASNAKFATLSPSIPGVPQILPLNLLKPPTDDLRVRQAILYAIDREAVIKAVLFGTAKAAHGPLSSTTWSYNPKVESMYPFDAAKAGQLLDEAGWVKGSGDVRQKNGQPLEVVYITDNTPNDSQVGQLVQSYLQQAGFKVDLQVLEYAATATDYLAGKHNIARIGLTNVDPDVLTTAFGSQNIKGTNFNRTMKPNPTLDKLLNSAAIETDRAKRKQDYEAIQISIMNQASFIPLWEQDLLWGASSKVNGLYPGVLGQIGFYDTWKTS